MGVSKIINKIVFSTIEPENPYVLWMVKDGEHYNFKYFQDGIWEPILVTKEELEALIETSSEIRQYVEEAYLQVQSVQNEVAGALSQSNQNVLTTEEYKNTTEGYMNTTSGLKEDVINLKQDTTDLRDEAISIVSGGPKGEYENLIALNLANPDHTYTYITLDNGHWNYWSIIESAYISGGIYQTPLDIVQEFGGSDTDVISQLVVTTKVQDIESIIAEQELVLEGKIDGAFAENGLLYLTSNGVTIGQGIEVGSGTGGGGGGVGTSMLARVTTGYTSSFASAENTPALLHYTFTSIYTQDNAPTGDGQLTVYVGGVSKLVKTIGQGDLIQDVAPYLAIGANRVTLSIVDSVGNSRTVQFTVTVASIGISSTLETITPYNSSIDFRYTLTGSLEKTVYFILDGVQLGTVVTSLVNRQLSYTIPTQVHGVHTLQVYATAIVNGVTLTSNILNYEIMWTEVGNNNILIASNFNQSIVPQFGTVAIEYIIYNPQSINSDISLYINNVLISSQTVNRQLQTWSYRVTTPDPITFRIDTDNSTKEFVVSVSGSIIDAEAETANLQLFLSSANRSNNEATKDEWIFGDIEAAFTDFNWATDGWQLDSENNTVLRVLGNGRVYIPLNIFQEDSRILGKTIEFEMATHDIIDYDSIVISCMSGGKGIQVKAQSALLYSQQLTFPTKFKEGERVRVSFVVGRRSENSLLYMYINGILSGVVQYSSTDNFIQASPVGITIGSNTCIVDIYNVRVYNSDLNSYQLINNKIVDTSNVDEMLNIYERNLVYNDLGYIDYNSVVDRIPCMTIIGSLPTFKGDKKAVNIEYENRQDTTKSFIATCKPGELDIDVQGTSSQFYPRKNFKLSFKKTVLTQNGVIVSGSKYKLRDTSIGVPTYTVKADFAESSGTHNTGLAKIIDNSLKTLGFLTPPQVINSAVRTTVDGFPIVIFNKLTEDSERVFVGKYNFNTDKGSTDAFGFTDTVNQESWEFLNNISPRCLFRSADFTSLDGLGDLAWKSDFEARYPEENTNITQIKILFDWIISCDGNPSKFKTECSQHFNVNFLLSYYIFTELFGMVDQRAKNQFLTTWGNEGGAYRKWYLIFYDNDTALGINNEGALVFDYNIEYHDEGVWDGQSSHSLLWELVEQGYAEELQTMYQNMRSTNVLSYNTLTNILNVEQSDKWSESIYNMDGKYKYIDPGIEQNNWQYLYEEQGSREEHRKWWVNNRIGYIDSKYSAGDFNSDYVTMRLYSPSGTLAVPVNHNFTLTPYSHRYLRVRYDSYLSSSRAYQNIPITITPPEGMEFNDTVTIIYGASAVKGLGSLASQYAGSIDFTNAVKLEEIIIGSDVVGYSNPYLGANGGSLNIGNNTSLRKIDIQNCVGLTAPLNVENCLNIEEIKAKGSSITAVILPEGGVLQTLELPATLSTLILKNQPQLGAGLYLDGLANLTALRIENCPNIDSYLLAKNAINAGGVDYIRLININAQDTDATILAATTLLQGIDDNGKYVSYPIITGLAHVDVISDTQLTAINNTYPELVVTYDLYDQIVSFYSSLVKSTCLAQGWDTNGDGELGTLELSKVLTLGTYFKGLAITKFDEFQYFTGLTNIPINTFTNCTSLTSITLPNTIQTIESGTATTGAFKGCTALTRIETPSSITRIGQYSFYECTGATVLDIRCNGVIDTAAFQGMSIATSLTLHEGITEIRTDAFYDFGNLNTNIGMLTLPSTLIKLNSAFIRSSFTSIAPLPSSLIQMDSAFYQSKISGVITIPSTLTTFGYTDDVGYVNGPFALSKITGLILQNPQDFIPVRMADSCSTLTNISIPSHVKKVYQRSLSYCTALTGTIPWTQFTYFGASCFFRSTGLNNQTVVFNPALTYIGSGAFNNIVFTSVKLQQVTPPTLAGTDAFTGTYPIYIPTGSLAAYSAATNWSAHTSRFVQY